MTVKSASNRLPQTIQRLARVHFLLVGAFGAQIIIFDAWQLITPQAVLQRWVAVLLLLSVVTVVWYYTHAKTPNPQAHRLLFALVAADIAFASYAVYIQRGMASRAVFLYVIPIVVSAALRSRAAIIATAILCIAAYITAAVSYFVFNFNEGYKIELYGEVGFYCLGFLVVGGLLSMLTTSDKTR